MYNKKGLLSADFKDKEWASSNDALFINLTQLKLTDDQPPTDDWDIPIPRPTDTYISPPATPLGGVNDTSDNESDHNSDDTILEGLKNMDFARPSEAHWFTLNQDNQGESSSQREPINTPDDIDNEISLENITCHH